MTTMVDAPERFAPGFTREAVERLSRAKGEPGWMLERRLAAWEAYEATPLPTAAQRAWKYTDVSKLRLDAFLPHAAGDGGDRFPLSSPGRDAASGALRQHDSHAGTAALDEALKQAGVVFCSLDQAVRERADLVREHF